MLLNAYVPLHGINSDRHWYTVTGRYIDNYRTFASDVGSNTQTHWQKKKKKVGWGHRLGQGLSTLLLWTSTQSIVASTFSIYAQHVPT